jgi:hypothetical protein
MLLTSLIDLLASKFNVLPIDITTILNDNNIRLDQRLLLERPNNKVTEKKKDNKIITNNIADVIIEKISHKNEIVERLDNERLDKIDIDVINIPEPETNIMQEKETKPVRGRGRPRKQKISQEEEEVCVEVSEVHMEGGDYYVTSENVVLRKSVGLEIEGILRDGKIVRRRKE